MIYIVEDDLKIREELAVFFRRNGYSCTYSDDYINMVTDILKIDPELVLLDINLPHIDGFHICKELRKVSDVPIIVVTSKDSDLDELMSIHLGADDFVTKPFNTQILLARVQNVLKRSKKESTTISVKELCLNLSNATLQFNQNTIEVTKNEMRILHILMQNEGQIVSRGDIMEALWQSDEFVDDNTLTVNINRLRKKMESIGIIDILKTKRGVGYTI